ncbi:MAG TPA: hypothetical protein VK619_18200 [Pyrinomonadaceae bacterium]|nr:hypothetical protein [Pyrinomonadaceae bacterium]
MSRILIGVMGPGRGATQDEMNAAFELGALIAREGWVLVTGGRSAGVMDAASRGAKSAGGLTVGILPTKDSKGISESVDIPIITGMGQARNNINVLSSRVVVACGMGAGTAAEVALALKAGKRAVLLHVNQESEAFFKSLGGDAIVIAGSPLEALDAVKKFIGA